MDNDGYIARMVGGRHLNTGKVTTEIRFRTVVGLGQTDCQIEPPDSKLLRIHAAFAKVLEISGVVEYVDRTEMQWQMKDRGTVSGDGKTDIGLLVSGRLAALH